MTPTSRAGSTAELLGTALLAAIVVGSGIFAERLSPDDIGLQLLENSTATAAGLVALILAFGADLGRALQSGREPRRPRVRRHAALASCSSTSPRRSQVHASA